jgi:hypothetical protein
LMRSSACAAIALPEFDASDRRDVHISSAPLSRACH